MISILFRVSACWQVAFFLVSLITSAVIGCRSRDASQLISLDEVFCFDAHHLMKPFLG